MNRISPVNALLACIALVTAPLASSACVADKFDDACPAGTTVVGHDCVYAADAGAGASGSGGGSAGATHAGSGGSGGITPGAGGVGPSAGAGGVSAAGGAGKGAASGSGAAGSAATSGSAGASGKGGAGGKAGAAGLGGTAGAAGKGGGAGGTSAGGSASGGTSGTGGAGTAGTGAGGTCNPADCPKPDPCFDAVCQSGACATAPSTKGATCATGVCDGTGLCVECVASSCTGNTFKGCDATGHYLSPVSCEIGCSADGCLSVAGIAAGGFSTCAWLSDGSARCWGWLETDYPNPTDPVKTTPKPTVVPGLSGVIAISIGTNHRCALSGQTTYCWGANDNGQLGDGTTNPSTTPIVPQGIPALQSIAAGAGATCGLTPTGDSWCWGATGKSMGTVVITNPGAKLAAADQATAIAVGLENFYGVVAGGIDAWGGDAFGQLGNGMPSGLWTNAPGFFVAGTYVTVATAGYTVCSVDAAGSVWCWGAGAQGQCGGSFAKMVEAPNKVDGVAGASQVVVGSNHACALAAGEVWCWGSNAGGQLGVSGGNTATPVKVAIPGAVTAIAAGSAHTCALAGGKVRCWGTNTEGQLGKGDLLGTSTPSAVLW